MPGQAARAHLIHGQDFWNGGNPRTRAGQPLPEVPIFACRKRGIESFQLFNQTPPHYYGVYGCRAGARGTFKTMFLEILGENLCDFAQGAYPPVPAIDQVKIRTSRSEHGFVEVRREPIVCVEETNPFRFDFAKTEIPCAADTGVGNSAQGNSRVGSGRGARYVPRRIVRTVVDYNRLPIWTGLGLEAGNRPRQRRFRIICRDDEPEGRW